MKEGKSGEREVSVIGIWMEQRDRKKGENEVKKVKKVKSMRGVRR